MLGLIQTSIFRKGLKRAIKRGLPIPLLDEAILLLREQKPLDPKYRDHALSGDYAGCRECHLLPDWLFIYRVYKDELVLVVILQRGDSENLANGFSARAKPLAAICLYSSADALSFFQPEHPSENGRPSAYFIC